MALTFIAKPEIGSDLVVAHGVEEQELVPNPSYWGPITWEMLYIFTAGYSNNPGVPEKIGFQLFLDSLRFVLPCAQCRGEFDKYISTHPLTNSVMASKTSLFEWVYNLHQSVSVRLLKPPMSSLLEMKQHYFPPKVSQLAALQLNAGPITNRILAAPAPVPSRQLVLTAPPQTALSIPMRPRSAFTSIAAIPSVNVRSAVRPVHTRRVTPIAALSAFQKPQTPVAPHFQAATRPRSVMGLVAQPQLVSRPRSAMNLVQPQRSFSAVRPTTATVSQLVQYVPAVRAPVTSRGTAVNAMTARGAARAVAPLYTKKCGCSGRR